MIKNKKKKKIESDDAAPRVAFGGRRSDAVPEKPYKKYSCYSVPSDSDRFDLEAAAFMAKEGRLSLCSRLLSPTYTVTDGFR